jgi:hypothetical protein
MGKKFWFACIAVLVYFELHSFLSNGVLLEPSYQSLQSLWRTDMMQLMWVFQVIMVVSAFFFVFIFSRGYEGKGLLEGVRFGLYIGVWMGIGFAYGTYAMIPIPYSLALSWFVSTLVQYSVAGIIASLLFGKVAVVTRASQR